MRFFEKVPVQVEGMVQGSSEYFLIEIKSLFSIILTHLAPHGTTTMHSHPFKALTFWLYGFGTEFNCNYELKSLYPGKVKLTSKDFHAIGTKDSGAWFLTFRGPWSDTWQEYRNGKPITLTHGRKEIE